MLLADTSGLLALLDRGEPEHASVTSAVEADDGPIVVLDFALAELDYLVLTRLGPKAELGLLEQLTEGVFVREPVTEADLRRAAAIGRRYREHALGLTDTAQMAVAERLGCPVLTLDRRHFELFRDKKGRPLTLLP